MVINPKVVSIGSALPASFYTQEQVWDALGYQYPHFKKLFTGSEISKRHFWVKPSSIKEMSWQDLQEEYLQGAIELSTQAVHSCLDGRKPRDIGCVVFVSCTGYQCPGIAHRIAESIGFNESTYYTNILGMGCEGGFPGLRRAYDYTLTSGKSSLVITTELSSCTFFPEVDGIPDPENGYEVLRANAIFGDASVAVLVDYDNDPRHPHIVDFESYCNSSYLSELGYIWRDGRLRVLLSNKVPELVPTVVYPACINLLLRNGLSIPKIQWFVVHAAGARVLDNIRDTLYIPEEKMNLSRDVLRTYGNCSSTTIGLIGKRLMEEDVKAGDRVLVLSVGPGMVGGATLLRFGNLE